MGQFPITTQLIEANGLQFETDICGDGDKLALLLHGFPESKHSWRHQMHVLAERGYTAWAPNLRGYGGSSRPKGAAAYSLDHLTDDVAGLIDAARDKGIQGPVTLMAHDWGGGIAWTFLLANKRPVDRYVVMNLPHPTLFASKVRGWNQFKKSWYVFFFQLPWLPEKAMTARGAQAIGDAFYNMAIDKTQFTPDVLAHYRENALIPGAMTAMINYYRAAVRHNNFSDLVETPPQISVPTLMLWGEEDIALGKELTFGTEKLVDELTIRYVPHTSHWVQQEAPETVNRILGAWLDDEPVPYAPLIRPQTEDASA